LVLAGYSQGAMAVHEAERRMAAAHDPALSRIGGTLLLGDGDRVDGTRARHFGSARPEAVGVRTYVHPGNGHDVPLAQSTADICDAGDLICDFAIRELAGPAAIRRAIGIHTAYAPRHGAGRYSPLLGQAATWVADRIAASRAPVRAVRRGPTLIDAGVSATFADWSAATGQPVEVTDRLPADMMGDRCVVLLLDGPFAARDHTRLDAYLRAGGTVVGVGERADGGRFSRADAALNALAGELGAGLALGDEAVDPGPTRTTRIAPSPFTSGVSSLGYDWASTVTLGAAAQPLVATADGTRTLVATQPVGAGTIVLAGDSNLVTDDDDGAYAADDNGRLARDLCG
ncbi:MAG: hypothetical protein JWM71_2545, partial [Solirubrobacteraceae bacterium]|nr:hypothetical protein [Solirubrobacteraceae bacterium]